MNIQFLPLLSALFVFWLGLFVFLKNKKSKLNLVFWLFSISICIWLFGTFMMFISDTNEKAFFWDKFVYIGVVFIPALVYHLGTLLIKTERKKRKVIIVGYILSFIFLILNIATPFFIDGIYKYSWGFHSRAQFFHHLFLVFFAFYLFLLFRGLFKVYKKDKGIKKEQVKYVFISLLILTTGSIAFLPAYGMGVYPLAYISGLLFAIILAYTIIRHRLMDVKFVLRKSSVYLTSLATIVIMAVAARYVCIRFFTDLTSWFYIIILTASVSVFLPIKNYYYGLANKYFFTSIYSGQKVIARLSDKLRSTLKVEMIYKYLSETFIDSFHAESVGILIYGKKAKNYLLDFNKGFNFSKKNKIKFPNDFFSKFIKHNKPIVIEEVKHFSYKKYKNTIDLLTDLNIAIIVPLNVKDKAVGLIVLGRKESGDIYNDKDLGVLKVIGAQAAIAIENALLYEETENFAIKLKKEVQKATADLKIANKELKKLDAAKSDFISIASHQLRTPLTVIKGYISMMIEGNFGKLTKEELSSLKKVYASNERLIQLVENLLNISRIESGKLQFNFSQTRLEEVVKSVFEELAGNARKKGLNFKYEEPDQALPKINIDGEKIRYVILNLVDNAIKYTKEGSVTISLKLKAKDIYFCVFDTGIGIKEEDSLNLFKRFSRGKGISVIHPEGTGIGLYVAKMMIKAHHGKIWVESEGRNKGSKFCFMLPISHNA